MKTGQNIKACGNGVVSAAEISTHMAQYRLLDSGENKATIHYDINVSSPLNKIKATKMT